MMNKQNINALKSSLLKPSAAEISTSIFLRLLGWIYLIAVFPFIFQYKGLFGENGVQPAKWLLEKAWENEGIFALFHFPSLYWIYPSDGMLLAIILANGLAALCMIMDFRPFLAAFTTWLTFISLTTIGGDFTIIIIDLFLAEIGFLAVLLAWSKKRLGYIPKILSFVAILLLFRMWFSMGMIKFYFPGDSWADLSFFDYFFPYQPMPNPISWYAHKCPHWVHVIGIIFTFIIEMIFPFFIFLGKRWRITALAGFTGISLMIWITGNYGYFNPLTILIGIFLLYDNDYPEKIKKRLIKIKEQPKIALNGIIPVSLILIIMHFIYIGMLFVPKLENPQNHLNYFCYFENTREAEGIKKIFLTPFRLISNLRIVNPYGVFKDMTRFRIELRFEGSNDGLTWKAYEFEYIPSGNTQTLRFFAPYYPRLDHVMFYETYGIGTYNNNPTKPKSIPQNPLNPYYKRENAWICKFLEGLEKNNPHITNLLSKNPFEEKPAQFIRVNAFLLNFTSMTEKEKTGNWWKQDYLFTPYDSSVEKRTHCQPLYNLEDIVREVQKHALKPKLGK